MRILVTGGAGFIGSFLCERLVRELLDFHPHVTWDQALDELVKWAGTADSWDGVDLADQALRNRGFLSNPYSAQASNT